MKILHFSDLHLDSTFDVRGFSLGYGNWRRQQLRATLGRIIALAKAEKVDLVTIAGDLFDYKHANPETSQFLIQQFERARPIKVFITPGEHDPFTNDSYYTLLNWPENVHIFNTSYLQQVELPENIVLWGAACPAAPSKNILSEINLNPDKINILLLHSHSNKETDSQVFFIEEKQFLVSDFKFGLFGCEHTKRAVPISKNPRIIYPGSPEPLATYQANSSHFVFVTDITAKNISSKFVKINELSQKTIFIDVSEIYTFVELSEKIHQEYFDLKTEFGKPILTINLVGNENFEINICDLEETLDNYPYIRINLDTVIDYNHDKLSKEQTIRGALVNRFIEMRKRKTDESDLEIIDLAEQYALQSFDGKRMGLR